MNRHVMVLASSAAAVVLFVIGCRSLHLSDLRQYGRAYSRSGHSAAGCTSPTCGSYFMTDRVTYDSYGTADRLNTESYDQVDENHFLAVGQHPLSTFAVDVDTASYANVRRFIDRGQLPPPEAVRIEELLNYFPYDYPQPQQAPFSVNVELATCPWNSGHRLARIGLQGKQLPHQQRPPANLVFLLDVSGSMDEPNKLPLLKSAMRMLVESLSQRDRVAIVVYANEAGLALPSTSCEHKRAILAAIDGLEADGSTNGGEGIKLAYAQAQKFFAPQRVNRVILCTDGDLNVGITDQRDLVRLIQRKADGGVYLSVLGFGTGNLKDSTLEKLADRGNGNYAYIDTRHEARKVLVEQLGSTLVTIAKDVKIQIEFNPSRIAAYRLIGYENRLLAAEDFNDDHKDAGEIGAGHTVTALYELIPTVSPDGRPRIDRLKYQRPLVPTRAAAGDEILTLKLRYKRPGAEVSELLSYTVSDPGNTLSEASTDFRFAAAVAGFGMLLRDSPHNSKATFDQVIQLAASARGNDPDGYRAEFVELVRTAKALQQ